MKHVLAAVVIVAATALPAAAAPITFTTLLSGPNESPANASPGTGVADVTIDPVAHTLRVVVSFSGLTSINNAAHIHVINGPGDANLLDTLGPVTTTTPTFTGFPSGTTFGTFDATFDTTLASTYRAGFITDAGGTTAAAEAALFAGIVSGRAYLNIHTTNFPGGEIRGFLTTVPEPSAMLLVGTGLLAMFARRRVRANRPR